MTFVAAALFALLLAVVIVGFFVLVTYNTVVALQRRVDRAVGNIEVALKQRFDEVPALVSAVRGELSFERSVLDEVARHRAAWSPEASLPHQASATDGLTGAIRSLFAVVEGYPTLRSQENVLALQKEIERLETVIAGRRELLNQQVYEYNATIAQLPAALLAGMFGWRPRPSFEGTDTEHARPEAGLSIG